MVAFRTPGIAPQVFQGIGGQNIPQAPIGAPQGAAPQNFAGRINQALNSPLFRLGTNLLQAGGPQPGFGNFGQAVGRAFDVTRNQLQSDAQQDLRRRLVEAQIAQLQTPTARQVPAGQTDIGKLRADMQRGLITPEEFQQEVTILRQEDESVPDYSNVQQLGTGEFVGLNKDTNKIEIIQVGESAQGLGQTQQQVENTNKLIADAKKDKRVDDFIQVSSSFDRVNSASPTAAGDLSLVFSYMKMLDPGSVVREGEQALARNAAGVPERIRTTYNNILEGETLSPAQRAEFKGEAQRVFNASRDRAQVAVDPIMARAGRLRLRPETISEAVFGLPQPEEEVAPSPFLEGQTATGPNGERIVFRNGQWQPM